MVSSTQRYASGQRRPCIAKILHENTLWMATILVFAMIIVILQCPSIVHSYLLQTHMISTTSISFASRHFRPILPTRTVHYSSNDDDDDDSIDRNMGRIGWGRTVLSEAMLQGGTSFNEYVLPEDSIIAEEITTTTTIAETASSTFGTEDTSIATTTTIVDNNDNSDAKITIGIALTREVGKNDALATAIQSCATLMQMNQFAVTLQTYELPCIQHGNGPDYPQLQDILFQQATTNTTKENVYDYIVITSPEAARVLASAWPWMDSNDTVPIIINSPPKVAAVGKATEDALREAGIEVSFVPTKATAQTLVNELPVLTSKNGENRITNVLYPASAKAADVLVTGLDARMMFHVVRLDTYDTIPAIWDTTQQQQQEQAQQCQIVCFASPSAIKGWITNLEMIGCNPYNYTAACIGETSATACHKLGWNEQQIFYPKEQPGMDGWIEAIMEAAATIAAADTTTYDESIIVSAKTTSNTPTADATK